MVHNEGGVTAFLPVGHGHPRSRVSRDSGGRCLWGISEVNVDELVTVWESIRLGPFQTKIIEGRLKPLLRSTLYVMITPLKVEGRQHETKPLPLGLHVLHAYTRLKNGSERVSLVVRNVSDSQIFLKKGVPVARVVSAMLVSPAELSPEMEATLGEESRLEPLSVEAKQEKLLEKLNLDGLAHWTPENAVAARELVLAYHDVFALKGNELGCTSAIEHEIRIENDEPFKEQFQRIPHPSWRRYAPLSGICWKQGRFIRANPHGVMPLSWSGRRMVPCISAWTSDTSMHVIRKIRTPCHEFMRPWRAWWGWRISHRWI